MGNDNERASADHDNDVAERHDEDGEDGGEVDDVAILQTAVNAVTGSRGFAVARLDGETGVTLWAKTYGSDFNDIPRDVALDRRGNILIAEDRSGQSGEPVSRFQEGQLVSLSRTGELNWVAFFPTRRVTADIPQRSFFAVAVDLDGDPVVGGYSEVQPSGPTRVMDTIKYTFDHEEDDERLTWDESMSQTVTGFRVCIDAQTGTACQDVGKPIGHALRTTTAGSLTYEIALSKLTSFTAGTRRISAIAYDGSEDSPASQALSVERSDERTDREGR